MSANKYLDRNQVRILVAAHFQAIKNLEITGTDPQQLAKRLAEEMKEILSSFDESSDAEVFKHFYTLEVETLQNTQRH